MIAFLETSSRAKAYRSDAFQREVGRYSSAPAATSVSTSTRS